MGRESGAFTSSISVESCRGRELLGLLPTLGRLRAAVFRDWPYLYDGSPEYESGYLRTYADSDRAAVFVARDRDEPVGMATCLPLADETANVTAPFRAQGLDPARFFYFGESVLLPRYRGQGIGVRFFELREAHARAASDCDYATFCAVQRQPDHPARPADAVPLDTFWQRRGYRFRPDLSCTMRWKEVGRADKTEHTLAFWLRSLTGAPLP